jgi:hypothetical protein
MFLPPFSFEMTCDASICFCIFKILGYLLDLILVPGIRLHFQGSYRGRSKEMSRMEVEWTVCVFQKSDGVWCRRSSKSW